jgi:hypothetical protein
MVNLGVQQVTTLLLCASFSLESLSVLFSLLHNTGSEFGPMAAVAGVPWPSRKRKYDASEALRDTHGNSGPSGAQPELGADVLLRAKRPRCANVGDCTLP